MNHLNVTTVVALVDVANLHDNLGERTMCMQRLCPDHLEELMFDTAPEDRWLDEDDAVEKTECDRCGDIGGRN